MISENLIRRPDHEHADRYERALTWNFYSVQKMGGTRSVAVAALMALLLCETSVASSVIFSKQLRAGLQRSEAPGPRAIPSPSSSDNSPGSFMIQMPFTVVSNDAKLGDRIKTHDAPIIEQTEPSGPTLVSIGDNNEKINFYTIRCREGVSCSSIIPAQVVPRETETEEGHRSVEETKRYLRRLNLSNGFGFNEESRSTDVASSYFEDEKNERKSKQLLFRDFRDYDDFWPGSQYRPMQLDQPKRDSNRRHFRDSFEGRDYRNPELISSITKDLPLGLHIIAPLNLFPGSIFEGRKYSSQIPSPIFSNALEWPYASADDSSRSVASNSQSHVSHSIKVNPANRRPLQSSKTKFANKKQKPNGWSRFSTSTVSQLDRNTGSWHKVSSSSSKLDSDGVQYKPPVYVPYGSNSRPFTSAAKPGSGSDSTYQHTSTGLTVLGVTESNTPTSSERPSIETLSGGYNGGTTSDSVSSLPTSWGSSSTPWSSSTVHSIDPRPANNSHKNLAHLMPVSASTHGEVRRGVVYKI
ncbi:uncharacterized protein LOC108681040 isoform X2 [Hyalella azteca]|uniref:Uncharacterized protein LOC108681040 isoform X2 n=1 Tax=Hyalella azteca TaxID=294128 RepID=A0A8B7PJH1_HYAAZ|nr:uncharacterized protein LOC108681040 isoform X2 [Hyalella azteca]